MRELSKHTFYLSYVYNSQDEKLVRATNHPLVKACLRNPKVLDVALKAFDEQWEEYTDAEFAERVRAAEKASVGAYTDQVFNCLLAWKSYDIDISVSNYEDIRYWIEMVISWKTVRMGGDQIILQDWYEIKQ